jgi:3-phosphoinositide dependent protein kinase-1
MDPDKRLGFREPGGYDELKAHPFFDGVDWDTLPEQV